MITKVDAAVANETDGFAGMSSMDGAQISALPTAIAARASTRPSVSRDRAIIGDLEAKGFFAGKFVVGIQ